MSAAAALLPRRPRARFSVQEEQLLKDGAQAQKEGKAAQDLASLVDSGKTPPKNAPDTSRMRALLLEGGETTA